MQVRVDDERCRGHGMCCSACPKVFEMSNDGYAITRMIDVPADLRDAVRLAVVQCPERAISITE